MNEMLNDLLSQGVVYVLFEKLNGDMREMRCTTAVDLIPETSRPSEGSTRKTSEDTRTVFDVDIQQWRSFRWNSVKDYELVEYKQNVNDSTNEDLKMPLSLTVQVPEGTTQVQLTGPFWMWEPNGGPVAVDNGDGTWTATVDPTPEVSMQYLWVCNGVQENLIGQKTPVTDGRNYANRIWRPTEGTEGLSTDIYDEYTGVTWVPVEDPVDAEAKAQAAVERSAAILDMQKSQQRMKMLEQAERLINQNNSEYARAADPETCTLCYIPVTLANVKAKADELMLYVNAVNVDPVTLDALPDPDPNANVAEDQTPTVEAGPTEEEVEAAAAEEAAAADAASDEVVVDDTSDTGGTGLPDDGEPSANTP